MLKKHHLFFDRVVNIGNGLLVIAAFIITDVLDGCFSFSLKSVFANLPIIGLLAVCIITALNSRDFSITSRFLSSGVIFRELAISYMLGFCFYTAIAWVFRLMVLERFCFLQATVLGFCLVCIANLFMHFIFRSARMHEKNFRNVVLVGNSFTLPDMIRTIEGDKALGLRIVAVLNLFNSEEEKLLTHSKYGDLRNIADTLNEQCVDYVFFTVYRQNPALVEKAILLCQERGIEVWLKPDFMSEGVWRARTDFLKKIPLLVFSIGPRTGWAVLIKRIFDFFLGSLLLLISGIPMLFIALLIRTTSPGDAFFLQKRSGVNGRKFVMYKFRTMYSDAEQRRAEINQKNEMKGPVFKMKDDPRITPVGRFLRKYSLDELPQFWNVLKGDMSLVGPRPPLPSEVAQYHGWQRRRLSMRPGITCIWQVTGRNKIADFEQWAKLDLDYIDQWSLWLDFKILLKTFPAVLGGTGS